MKIFNLTWSDKETWLYSLFLGDNSGNCGWTPKEKLNSLGRLQKNYKPCRAAKDLLCGALHCQFDTYSPSSHTKLRIINYLLTSVSYKMSDESLCAVATFDVGK